MSDFVYKARSSAGAHYITDVDSFIDNDPDDDDLDDEDDLYRYGWRERWQTLPDGSEKLVRTALTEKDLLSPQEGDYVSEDTMHRDVTEDFGGILRRRYRDERRVAVWRNLKINYKIPGVTDGPAPDLFVVDGVRDRDRKRKSFPLGKVSGRIKLAMEVVSDASKKKDYKDLPQIYAQLEVEEYLLLRGEGEYIDDVFDVKVWRRDPRTQQLCPVQPDARGHFTLDTVGLLVGTGPDSRGLMIWDAATEERQRTPMEEEVWQKARADKAERHARLEAESRRSAEEAMQKAEQARRDIEQEAQRLKQEAQKLKKEKQRLEKEKQTEAEQAERLNREMKAEIKRLQEQLRE